MLTDKNDLSYDIAKLDLEFMIKTAQTAMNRSKQALRDVIREDDNEREQYFIHMNRHNQEPYPEAPRTPCYSMMTNASNMIKAAEDYRNAVETWHMLRECRERGNIQIMK